ncbi:apolipoprotein lipid transfer particle isoform 1-T7 [Glossina fuscipes fuscipes]
MMGSNSSLKFTKCISCIVFLLMLQVEFGLTVRKNPLKDSRICGRPDCNASRKGKFSYLVNNVYNYDYTIELRTLFVGSGENVSNLFLRANVDFLYPSACEAYLRINEVKLWDKPGFHDNLNPASTNDDFYDYYGELDKELAAASAEETNTDEHQKSKKLESDLKANLLRFAFHDGRINELCPRTNEQNWVLNFKRGILSTFQNTMLRFDIDFNTTETDVSGTCDVQYSLETTDNVFITISKRKNMASCRNRYSTHTILQTTPYTFREDKTIWPILDSESYCNMTIDNNIYRNISCHERYQLMPFSNATSGAVTTSSHKLEFKGESSNNNQEFPYQDGELVEKRSTLLFDHTPVAKPTHGEIKASRELLKEMCTLGFPKIQREFIDAFIRFLQTTKHLDYKALTQLLARSASICDHGKNHVLESLPYIGSTAAYQVMRDQIISNGISKNLARNWMTSLSFIQRPNEETLETFYTILEFSRKKIDPEYTLGASAVVHSFCRHNENCGDHPRIRKTTNLLETEFLNLFNMYRGERRSRERMIVILKSLGNIGIVSGPFAAQLEDIIVDDATAIDIRLQAVLVFRRVDCEKYQQFFLNTYANHTMNSEVRILTYLQVMRCPNYAVINRIKTILEGEEVNQVGSFVWSHLKNLAKSSSPVRIEAQGLLLNDDLSNRFKLDIRKFSRNYEHSLFFDEYNFGTTTDLNLIFGTDSYLPRTFSLNFTAELFGQSVNFFDFSARAEGFEELVTSIFGPKGPLNREIFRKKFSFLNRWLGNESSEDLDGLDNILSIDGLRLKRSSTQESRENIEIIDDYDDDEESNRYKRSLAKDFRHRKDQIESEINSMNYKLDYNYSNPRTQIGIRIFGNDLWYHSLEGITEFKALTRELDIFHQISKILSGQEVTYTKSRVLLDASYNVPMAIGLPLGVNALAASSIDLRISGNLDRMEPNTDWHFDLQGKFKPSVSVDVIATLQADMFYAVSGIKIKGNLYSNSEIEANLKIRGKNLVSFSFDLPQETNEIFSARSELIVLAEDEEISQVGISQRRSNSTCTWPVLNRALGLQICSHFSVPDLSNSPNIIYPSLLLSGPTNFSIILKKSDPTATRYVFEYNLEQEGNSSNWSLLFHTPGSAVTRVLVTNVTTIPDAFNASVAFVSGGSKTSAGCSYVTNPDKRQLDFFLDTNGNKSLEMNMELTRSQERTTWIYTPKMLLAVNGVNITGLIGTVRTTEKNGIMQNDFEISFETKKLQALLRGSYVQTEITALTNVTITYRFQANKIESINYESKLTNVGDKAKTEYRGTMKLRTSAYPKLNFASNGTWLNLQGHSEGTLTYNNAPDLMDPFYTTSMRLIFIRSYSEDFPIEGCRTRASLEVKLPRSKVDFRILLKHEELSKNGTEHNALLGFRYAPEKEATALFSVHLPRRGLFVIDSYMNVTVPEFNSCVVHLRVNEISAKNFMINFNGSWFTNHSISVRGNYKDKSSRVQSIHRVKLILESPSFEITSIKMLYRRNQLLIYTDVQAHYAKDPYSLTAQYSTNPTNNNSNAAVRVKVMDQDYWTNIKLLSEKPKLLDIEIHLDKIRDVSAKLEMISLERRKELSVDLKWDANRDPSQRLGLSGEYSNPGDGQYVSNIMVTYPDRTISSGFDVYTGGPEYYGSFRSSWSSNEIIVLSYSAGVMPSKNIHNWIRVQLKTPFDGWAENGLQAGVYTNDRLILVNSSLLWAEDQSLDFAYKSDYEFNEPITNLDLYFGINSTIKDVPIINIKLTHWQNMKKFDTDFKLRYSDSNSSINVYSIKSLWELSKQAGFQNITGTMFMLSPFEGYRKGGLATKFMFNDRREIKGAASLDFDIREFTLAIDGYIRRFSDNMLTINITTPLENFRSINGRFGLNDKRRHAVAEVRAPLGVVGAEILCDIISMTNFDVKLSIAAPLDNFQQAALFGKIKPDTLDIHGIWNNATLGFTGVWRRANRTDFEYSYTVFTPLQGFEQNGFIVKFTKKDVFILHLHGKLSKYKLGIKIDGTPKSKLLNLLGGNKIELEILYDDDFHPPKMDVSDDYDIDDLDYDEFFSYFVDFEIDTVVWPTIHGKVDMQEIMDYYLIMGNIQLPQGQIEFKDRLFFPDYVTVLNVLTINTPFAAAPQLKSIIEYHTDIYFKHLYEKIQFVVTDLVQSPSVMGIEFNYTKIEDSVKPKEHEIKINIKTPFSVLPEIAIWGSLELEENIYRGNISSRTINTFISLATSVESEEQFFESSVGVILDSNIIPHYSCHGYIKKDFNENDNTVIIQFTVTDDHTVNELHIESAWFKDVSHLVNAYGRIKTTMLPLKLAELSIVITEGESPRLSCDLTLSSWEGHHVTYGSRAIKKDDTFNVEIWTPIEEYRNISMHGSILPSKDNKDEYQIFGNLYRNMATYAIAGVVKTNEKYPTDASLRIQDRNGGKGTVSLSVREFDRTTSKDLKFNFDVSENNGNKWHISGIYSLQDKNTVEVLTTIKSTVPDIKHIDFRGKMIAHNSSHVISDISLDTPWKEFGIDSVHLNSNFSVLKYGGNVGGEYRIGQSIGRGCFQWSWLLAENMQLLLKSYMERPNAGPRAVHVSAKYINPKQNFQQAETGGELDVDSKWKLSLNGLLNYMSTEDIRVGLDAALPPPVGDMHRFDLNYRGNLISKRGQEPQLFLEGSYNSDIAQRKCLGRISYKNSTDLHGLGHLEWGTLSNISTIAGDFHMLQKSERRREFHAKMSTPMHKNEDTFSMNGMYDMNEKDYHNLVCAINYPASQQIADFDIFFSTFSNMHGFLNSTTPFTNMSWFKADFNFTTTTDETFRYCKGTWPTDTAFFELHNINTTQSLNKNLKGGIQIEIPLATRHKTDVKYNFNENPSIDDGFLKIFYNNNEILDGVYNCTDDRGDPLRTKTINMRIQNDLKPLGVYYTHKKDISRPVEIMDEKHLEVYELQNALNFNLTGELHTLTRPDGQELKIIAIHPNRTVIVTTSYDMLDERILKHRSKLELSATAWIGYNILLKNYTTLGNDSGKFAIDLFYPKRNLSAEGWYYVTEEKISSDVLFKWANVNSFKKNAKVLRTGLIWQAEPLVNDDKEHQTVIVTVGHPDLEKDVVMKAKYYRGISELLKIDCVIDYSDEPDHLIGVGLVLKDMHQYLGSTNYLLQLNAHHMASDLELQLNGTVIMEPTLYKTKFDANYKRSFYDDRRGQFLTSLDVDKKEIEYIRESPHRSVRVWAIPTINFPLYGLNATIWDTPDMNDTGYLYIDLEKKFIRAEVNLTEDASQNLQLIGFIPDARSGYLDVWRNYEEIRIIDISSYLKMNHSRLITGRFHWRPKLRAEIKEKINTIGNSLYNLISEGIDFWIKSLYSETMEAIGIIWDTTRNYNQAFFDDIEQLSVLEEDFQDLRQFVNESYEANDFYIKTVLNFTLTMIDELAIRDHIGSLPKIFTEIWQAMGDSGKAIRNSIAWLIETVKKAYNNILSAVTRFFHGESLRYLSDLMEKGVHKYDRFIKDLHISFIKYVENLWNKFWNMMANYWRSVLKRLEPYLFKFITYAEKAAWDLSKELFDFIYKRTNALAESPYFNKVSSFTQDVDRLYRDIKSRDAVSNMKKYSNIAWNFIKEKYFKLVPFGAELNEVLTEIWEEIKELQKIEQVDLIVRKYKKLMEKLEWVAEELQLEVRLRQLYYLIANKLHNYATNAVETADMYREAKTKFIFDPDVGVMDIEQKLPMSWHAFNETPRFAEIPEYKLVAKIRNFFKTTNTSLIRYIYNLRQHFDPKTWLPPYQGRALLIGSHHYMTFDNRFVSMRKDFERNNQCFYLLAHDFFQENFTLLLEPSANLQHNAMIPSRKLSFIVSDQLIEIDFGNNHVSINGDSEILLPFKAGEAIVHRENDILTISSGTEFILNCNIQFDLCWIEISGWYFGHTAGVLGTMNNEPFDDLLTSKHYITENAHEFTDSWSLGGCKEKTKPVNLELSVAEKVKKICDDFFTSGILSACADTLDVKPFYEICIDLGSDANALQPENPVNKGACAAALAYIEACTNAHIPLRVPEQCIYCQLDNGSFVGEGTFIQLSDSQVPQSSDIVFIVEAKPCNENLMENKSIMSVVSVLEDQLLLQQISNNRYAVISFGGLPPFDKPRSIYHENSVFTTDYNKLTKYFSYIKTGNGTNHDILQAISTATHLNFRPGVSKTFILLPCSNCASKHMRFDYTSILQYMLEEGVNLHILADTEFEFEKTRKLRHFFGLDRNFVYSKRFPEGDAEARRQLHISRNNLGICTPLALETDGTVFSARRLMPERKYPIKRFATIFAKRVVKTAIPKVNQTCECSGYNTGVAYLACSPSTNLVEDFDINDYESEFDDWESQEDEDDIPSWV